MVFFKNLDPQHIMLLHNKNDSTENGTILTIHPFNEPVSDQPSSSHVLEHSQHWWRKLDSRLIGISDMLSQYPHSSVPVLLPTINSTGAPVDPYLLLGHKIISGDSHWSSENSSFNYFGEFHFIPKYWEWTEDILAHNKSICQQAGIFDAIFASLFLYEKDLHIMRAFCEYWCDNTNTLHISQGEVSISLWDLHEIGGLPIHGSFYCEVIPDEHEAQSLLASCHHLFSAFHHLSLKNGGPEKVDSKAWINFWFKDSKGFNEFSFRFLGIPDHIKENTYLAAFISCWLCEFVLPGAISHIIRPGVFKMASMIAGGQPYNLAIPVLASIYNGLGNISSSSFPDRCTTVFPAHYVYGWLASYFDTHIPRNDHFKSKPLMVRFSGRIRHFNPENANMRIHSFTNLKMWHIANLSPKDEFLTDHGKLVIAKAEYFLSHRSCYLSTFCGDSLIVQPYSPHRFGRQFGFCQDIPENLQGDFRTGTLRQLSQFWQHSTELGTKFKLLVPSLSYQYLSIRTKRYIDWWSQVHKSPSSTNVGFSIKRKQPCKVPLISAGFVPSLPVHGKTFNAGNSEYSSTNSDRCWKHMKLPKKIDTFSQKEPEMPTSHSQEETTSQSVVNTCPPDTDFLVFDNLENFVLDPALDLSIPEFENEITIPVIQTYDDPNLRSEDLDTSNICSSTDSYLKEQPLIFNVNEIIAQANQRHAKVLGDEILSQFKQTSYDKIGSLKESVEQLLTVIRGLDFIDAAPLEIGVRSFMDDAANYASLHSSFLHHIAPELYFCQLEEAKSHLSIAEDSEKSETETCNFLKNDLHKITSKKNKLKKELEDLAFQEAQLELSLSQSKDKVIQQQLTVSRFQEEISQINSTLVLTVEIQKTLKDTYQTAVGSHRNLIGLKWLA